MKRTTRRRLGLALVIAGLVAIMGGCSSNESKDPAGTVVTVRQPLTAAQVAAKIGCGSFVHDSRAKQGQHLFTADAGTCVIDGVTYGVNTFVTTAGRDAWLKAAGSLFGIKPKWETPYAVIYKATHQRSDGAQPAAKEAAAEYGCVNFKYDHYSRTGGQCQLHGRTVELETFPNKEARDIVVNALKETGPYVFVVKTDHVVISYPKI
jgi:hypothetical protein